MKNTSKQRLLGTKGRLLGYFQPNKDFRNTPDKCRGITKAMLASRQHFVSAGNYPKRHSPGGTHFRVHNRTQPKPASIISNPATTIPPCADSSTQTVLQVRGRDSLARTCLHTAIIARLSSLILKATRYVRR